MGTEWDSRFHAQIKTQVLQTCTARDGHIVFVCTVVNAPSSVRTFLKTVLITAALNVIQPDLSVASAEHVFGLCPDVPESIVDKQ